MVQGAAKAVAKPRKDTATSEGAGISEGKGTAESKARGAGARLRKITAAEMQAVPAPPGR